MKQLLLALSIFSSGLMLSQNFGGSEQVFQSDQVESIKLDTLPYSLYVAGNKKEAITGWILTKTKKELNLYHYNEGIENGYYAEYKRSKKRFRLIKAGFNKNGKTIQNLHFKTRKQFIDSNKWSYGLVKARVYNEHFGKDNDYLLYRDINFESSPYKVLNYHYYYESKKSKIVRHEEEYIRDIMNPSYFDTIRTYLPFELNSNDNPFTFMRFDGYYAAILRAGGKIEGAHMIKLYPNHSIKYQLVEGSNIENPKWIDIQETPFQLAGNTFNVKINGTEISFTNVKFFATFLHLKTQYQEQGLTKMESYQFIKTGRR